MKLFKTIFLFMVVYSVLILAGFTRLFWSEYKHTERQEGVAQADQFLSEDYSVPRRRRPVHNDFQH